MDSRIINAGLAGRFCRCLARLAATTPPGNSKRGTAALMGNRAVNVLRYDTPIWTAGRAALSYATGETRGASDRPQRLANRIRLQKGQLVANLGVSARQ